LDLASNHLASSPDINDVPSLLETGSMSFKKPSSPSAASADVGGPSSAANGSASHFEPLARLDCVLQATGVQVAVVVEQDEVRIVKRSGNGKGALRARLGLAPPLDPLVPLNNLC
jgi:hypothetical protein